MHVEMTSHEAVGQGLKGDRDLGSALVAATVERVLAALGACAAEEAVFSITLQHTRLVRPLDQ